MPQPANTPKHVVPWAPQDRWPNTTVQQTIEHLTQTLPAPVTFNPLTDNQTRLDAHNDTFRRISAMIEAVALVLHDQNMPFSAHVEQGLGERLITIPHSDPYPGAKVSASVTARNYATELYVEHPDHSFRRSLADYQALVATFIGFWLQHHNTCSAYLTALLAEQVHYDIQTIQSNLRHHAATMIDRLRQHQGFAEWYHDNIIVAALGNGYDIDRVRENTPGGMQAFEDGFSRWQCYQIASAHSEALIPEVEQLKREAGNRVIDVYEWGSTLLGFIGDLDLTGCVFEEKEVGTLTLVESRDATLEDYEQITHDAARVALYEQLRDRSCWTRFHINTTCDPSYARITRSEAIQLEASKAWHKIVEGSPFSVNIDTMQKQYAKWCVAMHPKTWVQPRDSRFENPVSERFKRYLRASEAVRSVEL